jgi:Ca2+-binding EF-hand superfamily protein
MDDMDMILMQPSTDKDDFPKISKSFSFSPRQSHLPPIELRPAETHVNRNPLKFHLNTTDSHGGYLLSLSHTRIGSFRHLLERSGLNQISAETACNAILGRDSRMRINKSDFDEAVQSMLAPSFEADRRSHQLIKDVFAGIFAVFDRGCKNDASALEVACGLTVLCRGKKSDKLEFAFEVLDKNKRGRLSRSDMATYLQSFLSVLLSIAFAPALDHDPIDDTITTMNGWRCDRTTATIIQASRGGADWAASLAFRDFERNSNQASSMSFDDFADWYTTVGFSRIPWLELLDLQKWASTPETK